jgi:hypothetical protein
MSHLAISVFYAHKGMAAEAEMNFQAPAKKTQPPSARRLLKMIVSWQSPE